MLEGFQFQALTTAHDRATFSCGTHPDLEDLDRFLRQFARQQDANRTTRVYVYAHDDGTIAGYFTLSAHMLELTGLPDALQRGRPRLPVPATLLGRYAVDVRFQGCGVGRYVLSYALREAYRSSEIVQSAFVIVDSIESAVERYKRFGFEPLASKPRRLVLEMDLIARMIV